MLNIKYWYSKKKGVYPVNESSKGSLALLASCFFWGCTPTVSKLGLESLPPLYFLGLSFLIGAIVLAFVFRKKLKFINRSIIFFALFTSIVLSAASILEIYGLKFISPMKSGLLISFETIFIPIFCFLLSKTVFEPKDVMNVIFAFLGLILINHNGISFEFNIGVILTILAAALFAVQTIIIGNLSKKYVPILISIVELFTASIICLSLASFTEKTFQPINPKSISALLFCGIFCSGIAFSLQTFGQKYISPLRTGIILSTIPVFGIIISHAIYNDVLSLCGLIGSIIIICSIINSNINTTKVFTYKFKKR